jgi:two-component system nitrate/nitrite response regulator NarL
MSANTGKRADSRFHVRPFFFVPAAYWSSNGTGGNLMDSAVPRVRVVVADGNPIFRDGLRRLLATDPGLLIVRETGQRGGAVAPVHELAPDILLLDLATSGPRAVDRLTELAASGVLARTIILTDCVDTPEVLRALQLGARGVILKDSAPEVLFKGIRSVMAGDFWIGREPASGVAAGLRKLRNTRRRTRALGLTEREIEIARAVVAGYSNKEIARRSSISENTVKSHLMHIFNKLGASNRVELALFAAHHRVLDGV